MYHEMFPQEIIEIQAEIQKHEALLIKLLQLPKDAPLELKLGEVAAHCGVVLDGFYDQQQIVELCGTLTRRLQRMRGELVLEVVRTMPPSPLVH